MLRLVIARPSPFARKVRVALIEKGIAFEEVMENPWLPGTGVPERNTLGKVPVLLLEDGGVVHDSKVIIEYLETLPAVVALLPAPGAARVSHRQIEAVADGICDAVVLQVLERARAAPSADWTARQMKKVEAGCGELDAAVSGARDGWLVGAEFGVADIAVGCALGYLDLRLPEYDWRSQFPALVAFATRLEARPSFAATRPEAQAIPGQ